MGEGLGATQDLRPGTHARSHPRPAPLKNNRHSLTPVKSMTDLVSHNPGQTQEYQNVSLFEHQTVPSTPSRLASAAPLQPALQASPGRMQAHHLHLPEGPPARARARTNTHAHINTHTHAHAHRFQAGRRPTQTLPRCPLQRLGGRL